MKRLVFSILVVASVLGSIGVGSWAYFSDVATSTGNSFTMGTLDLRVREGAGADEWDWADGVSITWSMTNMKPGDEVYRWVDLKSVGSLQGGSLRARADNTVQGTQDMDRMLEIASLALTNGATTDGRALVADANGNGWKDLDDLEAGPLVLPWDPTGGVHTWELSVRFHPTAGNPYKGGTVTSTFSFVLNQ